MQNKTILRVIKNNNYTLVHNEILNRNDLSWKAKGIMVYLLSKPDNWVFHLDNLVEQATDGKDSFRKGWKELQALGYVERKAIKNELGVIVRWETIVKEAINHPLTDYPQMENPLMENPLVENPPLLNTDNTKYLNILNTEYMYGEFKNVKLTQEELEKLKERYPSQYENMIEELSQYIASSGKKYKSHYATILSWIRKKENETPAGKKIIKREIYKSNDRVAGNQTAIKKELEDILKNF